MTVEAAAPPRGPWRARLPWILLALSLALNLFFIGGVFWVRAHHGHLTPAERVEQVVRQLSLDDNQRAAFDGFIRTVRARARQLRETNQPLVEQAWQEFAKPQPDQAALDKLVEAAADNRRAFQIDAERALRSFLGALNEDQRVQFIALARKRDGRNTPPLLRQLVQ